ncbi:MAG: T9SS type A sorting domain-containing protein [Flavobacteriales bacterium]|nr:T9SS type A sorting domain-containing protein [Flavobacteriales bacterium]
MAVAINNAELEISDVNGKRIMIRNVNLEKGTTEFTFDRATMNPGTYFIQMRSDKVVLNPIKLIVK